jgi:hypothetical protein
MIDWGAFLVVALVAVVSSCAVVAVYSVGLRFWSWADTLAGKYAVRDDGTIAPATESTPAQRGTPGQVTLARTLGVVCFVVCAAVVLYGIYLIVPQFH